MSHIDDLTALAIADGRGAPEEAWVHAAGCEPCGAVIAKAAHAVSAARGDGGATARGYSLGVEIARGGMGRVVRAEDERLHRPVAIKLSTARDEDARFAREIAVTAGLQHPNIIPVYDAGELDGTPFYAMRPVAGQRLDQRIAQATTRLARLELLPQLLAVVDAIAYAHEQGTIHRDLKPPNVLVGEHGETVVIDWGLAKRIGDDGSAEASLVAVAVSGEHTVAGAVLGTPGYMAPEQARGETTDRRTDVYALGCMMFAILTGRRPYTGPPAAAVEFAAAGGGLDATAVAELPVELRAIVKKATAAAPSARYADAGELGRELRRYQAGLHVEAHDYRWFQRVGRFARRNRLGMAVAASVVLSTGIIGGLAVSRVITARNRATQEAAIAKAERERATTERTAAEELLSYLNAQLPERLAEIGQLDAFQDAAAKFDDYYTRVGALRTDSNTFRTQLAHIRGTRGVLAGRQGDRAAADAFAAQAVALATEAETRGDPGATYELVRSLAQAGAARHTLGDVDGAKAVFEKARTVLERAPLTPEMQRMRVDVAIRLAGYARDHDQFEVVRTEIAKAHAALEPDDGKTAWRPYRLAVIEDIEGQLHYALAERAEARASLERSIDAARLAQSRAPLRSDTYQTAVAAENLLGVVLGELGDVPAEKRALADVVQQYELLLRIDETNVTNRAGLALTLSALAQLGSTEEAKALEARAVAILDDVNAGPGATTETLGNEIEVLRRVPDHEKALRIAERLPLGDRVCSQVTLARDDVEDARREHRADAQRAAVAHAEEALARLDPTTTPPCARFMPFEVLTERIEVTPRGERAPVVAKAQALIDAERSGHADPAILDSMASLLKEAQEK